MQTLNLENTMSVKHVREPYGVKAVGFGVTAVEVQIVSNTDACQNSGNSFHG